MRTIFEMAWRAFRDARQRHADAQALERLDERALRDIGFETEANYRRDSMQRAAGRFWML